MDVQISATNATGLHFDLWLHFQRDIPSYRSNLSTDQNIIIPNKWQRFLNDTEFSRL